MDTLTEFTQQLIKNTVPWAKPSSYGQLWWTTEVQEIVNTERALRRRWRTSQDPCDLQLRVAASQEKARTIRKAKQKTFRNMIHEACEGEGLWRMAKRGRTTQGAQVLPVMPPLITDSGTAQTLPDKVQALRRRFYPIVEAELSDITDSTFDDASFQDPLTVDRIVEPQEVTSLLRTRRANRAPGSDSIPKRLPKSYGGAPSNSSGRNPDCMLEAGSLPKAVQTCPYDRPPQARKSCVRRPRGMATNCTPEYNRQASRRPHGQPTTGHS